MNKRVKVPRTMSELRTGLDDHSVLAFYHTCQTCHRPTDLRRFSRPTTTDAYLIQFEEGYEPYVILNRSSTTPMAAGVKVPRYDETFVGRGWDKMSFFYELALGQQRPFVVLPRYFLVHHGKGDMPKFLTMEYIKRQEVNRALMGMFKERMAELYSHLEADGSAAVTPPSSDATPSSIEQGGGASQPDENCLQHRHGNEQHGRHDASTTLESKRRASPPQIPVAISDDLLWRS
ncbi:glycosyltransferase, putative, partial [Bodo saltans]